jgi:myosin heavy subunit
MYFKKERFFMKIKQFLELGLDEETAKKCEEASLKELEGFIPMSRFKEVNDAKNDLEKTVKERNDQLEQLKTTSGNIKELQAKITSLQEENKKKDDAHKAELHQLKIENAVKDALVDAKARNITAVKSLLKDLDKAKFDDEGKIKGLAEQIEQLKQSDGYLFETKTKPSIKGAQIGETGNDDAVAKTVNTDGMTYTQMVEYLANNPDAKLD